ncbi:MAG: hypothetical protein ACRBCI_08720 [Cellvibrionaceae bacterium]
MKNTLLRSCPFLFCLLSTFAWAESYPAKISSYGYQKPGASIRLLEPKIFIDSAKKEFDASINLVVGYAYGSMSVVISPLDELELLTGELSNELVLDGAFDYQVPLTLYAHSSGKYYLPLNVVVRFPSGQTVHRSLSAIVVVGSQDSRSVVDGPSVSGPRELGGGLIKPLPAVEELKYK